VLSVYKAFNDFAYTPTVLPISCFALWQGKSLSLICGSLTWLRDFEKRQKLELNSLLNSKLYDSLAIVKG